MSGRNPGQSREQGVKPQKGLAARARQKGGEPWMSESRGKVIIEKEAVVNNGEGHEKSTKIRTGHFPLNFHH